MSKITSILAEKCARAMALMEKAQTLIAQVLDDPAYEAARESSEWPRGVCPDGVDDYLPLAIGMLTPEPIPNPWDDDYVAPERPKLRLVNNTHGVQR
ncbi:MAG TPA: hypothetical protein VHX52_05310 [Steroidobacteraceae bacterium]|jgi:hypothetical protein|nr:hypothetical protein [Steroidobacteraceae bacterium]